MVDELAKELSFYAGGCSEVVLLGDIFDLWRVRPEKAIHDSLNFFRALSRLGLRIRYVVGNHDHHLVVLNQEQEFMQRMARGDVYPIYIPALRWRQVIDGLGIEMFYPSYKVRCGDRTALFTHGHHLGGVQALSMQLVRRLRRLSGEELIPADLEIMMTYAYESIYRSATIGEMVSFEDRLWRASSLLKWFRAGVSRSSRFATVEHQYPAILKFLGDQNQEAVDCFIYGDTHQAGIFQRKNGPLAINTGSFLHDDGCGCVPRTPDTYLIMSEEGMVLRQLGREKPLFFCELL